MTAYETMMVLIGVIGLLISFGGLLVALLTFLDKRNKRKK
ncbi:MAG: putative holin-like toxin [Clostridiaceae bacterium]|nr:putative holin-like toxin [Clostridiaceae bacterium]